MKLEHYTNNGYDSIILRDGDNEIVGAWPNDATAIHEFYAANCEPSEWEANGNDWRPVADIDTLVATIDDSGKLIAENADLFADRRDFWGV